MTILHEEQQKNNLGPFFFNYMHSRNEKNLIF